MTFYTSKHNFNWQFLLSLQSFFGRTYNNLSSISECKNNGECVINKKNRTACKACRLRKCLLVGMSKSGSRYGRRSNWFKIHCLLQEQQNKANNNNSSAGQQNMPPSNTQPNILPNDFISSHFLANLYSNFNNNNKEIKRVSSPSDSGASSADETSLKFNNNNNNNITKSKNLNTVKTEKIPSNSSPRPNDGYVSPVISRKISSSSSSSNPIKPMSPFLPFTLHQHHHHHSLSPSMSSRTPNTPELFMLSLPQISLTASPMQRHTTNGSNYNVIEDSVQNEPIDLSVKSTKRLRDDIDVTPAIRSSPSHDMAAAVTKTVPLDLTLIRSGWSLNFTCSFLDHTLNKTEPSTYAHLMPFFGC